MLLEVTNANDESSVLLVQDWGTKFLPGKFTESQSDWFAKRGMSSHITVATQRTENKELQMMTFVHVFQTSNQDSCAVRSIMKDVIGKLKSHLNQLRSVFYKLDNADCYHCGMFNVWASFPSRRHGVFVKRLDFSDPQCGKGPCDGKEA